MMISARWFVEKVIVICGGWRKFGPMMAASSDDPFMKAFILEAGQLVGSNGEDGML